MHALDRRLQRFPLRLELSNRIALHCVESLELSQYTASPPVGPHVPPYSLDYYVFVTTDNCRHENDMATSHRAHVANKLMAVAIKANPSLAGSPLHTQALVACLLHAWRVQEIGGNHSSPLQARV